MTTSIPTTVPADSPPAPSGASSRRTPGRRRPTRERLLPYLLLAPAVVALLGLLGWPALQVIGISFRKLDLGEVVRGDVVWVGLANYAEIFADPEFWAITLRTLVFTASLVAATVAAGLLLALLMRHVPTWVRITLQVSLVLAWAMPFIASTTVFQWIFDQQYGILNKTLVAIGFDSFAGHSWFSSGASTLTVIGLLIVWQAVPFVAFTLYAGLLGVSKDLYEAASIDGASALQSFRSVSWPALRPVFTLTIFLSVLWDFKVFTQVWAVREGGPDGESTTLPVLLYLKGIASSHFGVASAVATLMILLLVLITARYLQLLLRTREGQD
ncbi:carbohydrate ABC transporter permease [Amycolatopsis suaedae]|uniref:Sugar ABC transporter permease n=1 Tax=Amycolatopsis suaedae TaxID=2510978 RepID=A0A4Q7JFZ3_9PSEU|nr:sugar ABC transporter permease [Amycolatopsis suaedae]RZQ65883.1 sugar ABC transporter permease [Amycolatopsis suaedae]